MKIPSQLWTLDFDTLGPTSTKQEGKGRNRPMTHFEPPEERGHGPKGHASPQVSSACSARGGGTLLEVLDGASALRLATAAGRRRTEWSEW